MALPGEEDELRWVEWGRLDNNILSEIELGIPSEISTTEGGSLIAEF